MKRFGAQDAGRTDGSRRSPSYIEREQQCFRCMELIGEQVANYKRKRLTHGQAKGSIKLLLAVLPSQR